MSEASPSLREETQRETASGILGAVQRFMDWAGQRPLRAGIGLGFIVVLFFMALIWVNFEIFVTKIDDWRGNEIAAKLEAERLRLDGETLDRQIARSIRNTRLSTGSARGVARAYVFSKDNLGRIIGVVDVYEDMDPETERTGVRTYPLPLDDIAPSVAFMLADYANPRCIARNRDEYKSPALKEFLRRAGLKSSVACPITGLDGEPLGLLAFSSRTPLDRSPDLEPAVRTLALRLGGYWGRAPMVRSAIERFQENEE